MRQTLFYIPGDIDGIPLFGFGILLAVWAVASVILLAVLIRQQGFNAETKGYLPLLGLIGAVIGFVLPRLAEPQGLPLRGYGVMMLAGVVSGVWLSVHRARRMGLDPEVIFSLAFWMFLLGILGARLFYVIEYWHEQFEPNPAIAARDTLWESLGAMINVPQGGLVVYGSAFGAGLALLLFVYKNRLPGLALADLITPSLMVGLAFGRIGCYLNGCCFGGVCDLPWAVQFPGPSPSLPDGSPPFQQQVARGLLSPDAPSSLPVHPAQLYSTLDAALICLFLLAYYPFRRRDGELLAWLLTIYPITRYLIEIIRTDESGMFGTELSISQIVSLLILALIAVFWVYLLRQPRGVVCGNWQVETK